MRHVLACPNDLSPLSDEFEIIGTFNPGAARTNGGFVVLARVAVRPRDYRAGFTGLPRWSSSGKVVVDWVADDKLEFADPRYVRWKSDGSTRLTFTSYLQVIRSFDGEIAVDYRASILVPESPVEEYGIEDPRITPLEGRFYTTYVAVSRHGVATALASTEDFSSFVRKGIIFGPENKDVVLFPERIDGQYIAIHRPSGSAGFSTPEMWLAKSPDLLHWGQHQHLLCAGADWDSGRIGAGPPPVRIPEGWLVIYHGATKPNRRGEVGTYSAGAILLDHEDPSRVLRRTKTPLLRPEVDFEREGFVPNVVFPSGIVAEGRSLLIYYGAADTVSAVVRMSVDEVLASMRD